MFFLNPYYVFWRLIPKIRPRMPLSIFGLRTTTTFICQLPFRQYRLRLSPAIISTQAMTTIAIVYGNNAATSIPAAKEMHAELLESQHLKKITAQPYCLQPADKAARRMSHRSLQYNHRRRFSLLLFRSLPSSHSLISFACSIIAQ